MPEFTLYAKIIRLGKRTHKIRNTPIMRLHEWPTSAQHLIDIFGEAAKQIYLDHNQQLLTEISLDRHLAGRYIRAMINYHESHIHTNRIPEVKAKILYNPKTETTKIKAATFLTPEAFQKYKFDYDFIMKKPWSLKPVVSPGQIKQLLDPKALFRNLLTVKTPNYDPLPVGIYGTSQERHQSMGCYDAIFHGTYNSGLEGSVENDRFERQSRIRG